MDVTVVIPTFNRWDALERTLQALARVNSPAIEWEVVIVDDGSTDQTEECVRDWIEGARINVRYVKQTNSGPAAARNRGASEASGDVLIFIDNDILVQPDFVRSHVEALAANPGCWVLGRVTHPAELRDTPFGRYRDSLFESFHRAHPDDRLSETEGMSTQNVSMPAEDFKRLGGFDESFTIASSEDWELAMRARRDGIRVLYHPRISVLHNDWATTLDALCERQWLYSISDVLLGKKLGSVSPRRQLVLEAGPICWRQDGLRLVLKKAIKQVLAMTLGRALIRYSCSFLEHVVPDGKLSHRAYDVAVAVSILRGVREGFRRYGSASGDSVCPVCHLIDANLDTAYFRSIARYHDAHRFPVMIGSLAPDGQLQNAMRDLGTPTFSLDAGSRWKYPLAILRLARRLRRQRVAVLHAHCFDATFMGLIASRLAGVPFVFTRHHSDHNIRLGKRWHMRIDAWCAKHADHVIAVSEATRRVMIDVEAVPENQITVIYNGMEPLRQPAPDNVEVVRCELGLSDQTVCLVLARLHEEKGHRYLFDAIPEIQSRVGPIVFLLGGDGPHRAHLEADALARGLQESVRFLGRRDDVPELISLASVVVLPSLAESFGFVLLEAMSLGTPVVAAATGGIPELLRDRENGLLVPPADSGALAAAISAMIENPELARSLAERGRACVGAFSFERMIRGYESVYARLQAASESGRIDARASTESAKGRTIAD